MLWSDWALGVHVILLVLSCGGSNVVTIDNVKQPPVSHILT